ncbi:MAG TPA: hypothetical protein VF120_02420 [Ktedonobacterales bacterium]
MRHIKFTFAIAFAALATTLILSVPVVAAHGEGDLAKVRFATIRYLNVNVAREHGYALLTDAAGIACIDNPPVGAMGVHFVNGDLVASGKIDPLKPQALVYQPVENGKFQLVAVEYIAFKQAWDATHNSPPTLFGQQFMLTTAPNRFGLPAFYSLHAWVWKQNPSGTFSMWNPEVHCPTTSSAKGSA